MNAHTTSTVTGVPTGRWFYRGELVVDTLAGATAGATMGVLAGPPGIIAGALVGGAIGAAAAAALHIGQLERDLHDADLDREIGVYGGSIGDALAAPQPSRLGRLHAASLGIEPASVSGPGTWDIT